MLYYGYINEIFMARRCDMSFSNEIVKVRKKAFLTQVEFAKEIGVSFSTVNRWENDKGKPNNNAMKKLQSFCRTHGIPYEKLELEWL